ncbi:MAG: CRISPR-associated protein Cas4 [Thermogladius sp.]|nr:CRISPR-associated protein Cas4 [Thermogladius sp.]
MRFNANPLTPSMVKELVYCPVVVWLKTRHLVQEPPTDSMRAGAGVSGGEVYVKAGVYTAVLDEVRAEEGGVSVVEKKAFKTRSIQRYLAQLSAGAYIYSLSGQRVRRIILEVADERRVLDFNSELVETAKRYLREVEEVSGSDRPPQPVKPGSRCVSCWYKRFCPYSE